MDEQEQHAEQHAAFGGRIVMLGFGSIGQAILPLLFRHIALRPEQVRIISRGPDRSGIAAQYGVAFQAQPLTDSNYESVLDDNMGERDFLLNLSVEVASLDLIRYCWRRHILYLDTCIEPWPGNYDSPQRTLSQRSNYALREAVLAFRLDKRDGATAVITQGANPGLASAFVKQALLAMAGSQDIEAGRPACYEDWAALAQRLDIKVIHIAERDTQVSSRRKQHDEFVKRGRSPASSAKACSRPSWAGAAMNGTGRPTPAGTVTAATPPSICSVRAWPPACAAGPRSRAPTTASWSPTANRFPSPTT